MPRVTGFLRQISLLLVSIATISAYLAVSWLKVRV